MRISKVIFICCFLLPFLASCTRDEIEDNSYPLAEYDGTGVLFRLKAEAFDDTGSATRTVDLTAPFDTLCAYVLKEGQIDIDREVKFPDPATIMVEGLETGTYNLLILAMKGNYEEDGARIHKIEKSSSPWLSFPENMPAKPLKAQYYYTNHKFSVINGKIKIEEIRIQKRLRAQIGSRLSFYSFGRQQELFCPACRRQPFGTAKHSILLFIGTKTVLIFPYRKGWFFRSSSSKYNESPKGKF